MTKYYLQDQKTLQYFYRGYPSKKKPAAYSSFSSASDAFQRLIKANNGDWDLGPVRIVSSDDPDMFKSLRARYARGKNPVKKTTRKKAGRKKNPERITQAWLEKRVALINDMMGNPEAAYTRGADGGLKNNQGHLYIDHAYGGVGLEEMGRSGANAISGGHVPKRELNTFLDGMIGALRLLDQRKRGRNPATRKRATKKRATKKRVARKNPVKHKMWQVFKCKGNNLMFLMIPTPGSSAVHWTKDQKYGMAFTYKNLAERTARSLANKMGTTYAIGISDYESTPTEIKKSCSGKV